MAEKFTLARPYARAVFAQAKESRALEAWSDVLDALSEIVKQKEVQRMLIDPRLSGKALESVLIELTNSVSPEAVKKNSDKFSNFIQLLIEEKRCDVLPNIAVLYHQLLLAEQHVVEAEVVSAFPLSSDHREQIEKALEKRFKSKIQLNLREDEKLIGGALIRAGNWVMDGTVKGKLIKLRECLEV